MGCEFPYRPYRIEFGLAPQKKLAWVERRGVFQASWRHFCNAWSTSCTIYTSIFSPISACNSHSIFDTPHRPFDSFETSPPTRIPFLPEESVPAAPTLWVLPSPSVSISLEDLSKTSSRGKMEEHYLQGELRSSTACDFSGLSLQPPYYAATGDPRGLESQRY